MQPARRDTRLHAVAARKPRVVRHGTRIAQSRRSGTFHSVY
ncbi:hypothetical protein C7S14_4936 [Burkholderia cepacia]|nr:hypothetical protein C7S14_4936 [Burkholderia cepacia]